MPKLLKVHHEKFAQAVASGLSASAAYRKVSGNSRNANVHSDEWMKARGVEERIRELQEENNRKSELSREEALQWLSDLIRTPIGSVDKDSALAQAYEEDGAGNVKVRLADKIAGMQRLSKMTGWFEPEKIQVGGDTLSAYLVALRAKPIFELERPALPLENGGNAKESRE